MKILAALDLLTALLSRGALVSQMIQQAHEEGRDSLNKAETDQLVAADDAGRAKLVGAIGRAKEREGSAG